MDTLTDPRLADSKKVYSTMKSYIDAAADFKEHASGDYKLDSSMISTRKIELAVPEGTTGAQWQQLQKAVDYGASKDIPVNITVIK